MKHLPFSVFKRTDRPCYLVSFKNEVIGEYLQAISTKQKTEAEAIKTAFIWLRDVYWIAWFSLRRSYMKLKQAS